MTTPCTTIECLTIARREGSVQDAAGRETKLSVAQYDRLLQSLPNGVVIISDAGKIVHVNEQLETMFGYGKEELLGKDIELLMPERFRARHRTHVSDYLAHPRPRPMGSGLDLFGIKKDGMEFPVDISLSYLPTEGGTLALAVVRDISERKETEHKIELNYRIQKAISSVLKIALEPVSLDEQLNGVLEVILTIPSFATRARAGIFLLEREPATLALKAMHGFSVAQVDACKTVSLGGPAACPVVSTSCLSEPRKIEYAVSGATGQYCVPISFGQKTLGLITVAVSDGRTRTSEEEEFLSAIADSLAGLVERHQAEQEKSRLREQLGEAEKLAALGRITANVSHTIKNPLMAIGGFANRLLDKLPEGTKERKYAGMIFTEAVRLENVLQNVLLYSRRDADRREELDLAAIIEKAVAMYEDVCREKSIVLTNAVEEVPSVLGNKEQVLQAVENLISNAIDAMRDGGALAVTVGTEEARGTRFGVIRIKDTGQGIERENINRIFEPFFSTKLQLKGTGLGLSITKKVIDDHGGFISVDSEVGKGTTFSLFFPAREH